MVSWVAILIGSLMLSACSTAPRKRPAAPAPVLHPRISTIAVARPVQAAKESAQKAASSVATAAASVKRQAELVRQIALEIPETPAAPAVQELLEENARAESSLAKAAEELQATQAKLDESQAKTVELDTTIAQQTDKLNLVEEEKATALVRADTLSDQLQTAQKELSAAKRTIFWSKVKTWGVGLGFAGLIAAAFAFKVVGLGSKFL